ncbi:interleukin-17 receptor A isoform X2 [Rhineura floridana]|uniref:interleukin-17 receptor A isoform X2 n=1 Tax=Rhineura floridana TaxID=261503 RepID=UPI002AC83640|nr:interleukin-17 receptor A isoform X2 [Rhineura floridana]
MPRSFSQGHALPLCSSSGSTLPCAKQILPSQSHFIWLVCVDLVYVWLRSAATVHKMETNFLTDAPSSSLHGNIQTKCRDKPPTIGTCMDQSWLSCSKWTPSAPSSLDVHIDTFDDKEKLLPVLKIEWNVATDASIQHLKGAELAVLQMSSNQQVCVQFDFQNNLSFQVRPDGGGRWNFSFNRFEVLPGQAYQVTVHHLPKLCSAGDYNRKSLSFIVPDCTDPVMKTTAPCLQIGSAWEPSIDGRSIDDETVLVSFNPAMESASYLIHVTSFQEDDKECKKTTKEICSPSSCSPSSSPHEAFTSEGLQQPLNVTVKLERNLKSCCKYKVQIQPFFARCATDCMRHSVFIPCFPSPLTITDNLSTVLPWGLTFMCILLVGSAVASVIWLARRQKGINLGSSNTDATHQELLPMSQSPPSLKPRKIWIVYSADHKLYVDVVMKFAQFMITVCGTEVVLDLLNERQISEMGAVRWLTRQKQEMEALTSKIIILCSQGTRAKWQAMLGHEELTVSLKQDNLLPIGDMFTPALNLILPDFKQPACFGMYLVCYFKGISTERDIPDPFNVTSKYQLMEKFEEVYFLIQDLEKFEPGRIHQIPEISPERYTESPSGRQLKEAVQKFQKWQAEHPDWFKRENDGSEYKDDLQSLNGDLSDELPEGRILKQQLLPQEPVPSSCCLVNLLVNKDEFRACKLLPQLLPQEDQAFQTLVVPADDTSQAQVVVPVALSEEREIFSHQLLTNGEWLERVPMMLTSTPGRNNVILQEELSSNPHPWPADVKQQLEGLMYSLYQQSISTSDPPLRQEDVNEQQLVFDESCKDQRQSVQSDQGYISRCSPLPSDSPVEEEEDQEQEGHGSAGHLSPDVLDSLKSLQQQLLFQDIQQHFS